jgi:glutaredoxin-like YruB-family protein
MKLKDIKSLSHLQEELKVNEKSFLLLYKSGSDQSECALHNLSKVEGDEQSMKVLSADVNDVRDIHDKYQIKSVPTLLEFNGNEMVQIIKGCHESGFFESLFKNSLYSAKQIKEEKKGKRVIVYTTPTCPHCTTAKNYLKGLKIPFRDVNVAADQKMAEAMVKKSGQQGVPQIEINGKMIVAFNKPKIDELLEIK